MTRQWLRTVRLTVGDSTEETDLSDLRIRFQVRQADLKTPNWAEITVTNPAEATINKAKKEYTKVTLQAGYAGNFATIFSGDIIQKRSGRENPTDTFLTILAKDAGQAYDYAVVNKSLAAGHTFRDQVNACLEVLKPFGVLTGFIADLGSATMPRGAVLFGMVRDRLEDIAQATNTSWSIQNGTFQMVKNNSYLPNEAIVLNSHTGLIGMPVQTIDGIEVRCLLNPQIKPGSRIKIDQASILDAPLDLSIPGTVDNSMIPSKADDGIYKVLVVDHSGDTRGNPYYSDMICIRADGQGPLPPGLAARGIVLDPTAK